MTRITAIALIVLAQSVMGAATPTEQPKIQTRDLSNEALIKQNKTITALAADELSKTLPQKIDRYTQLLKVVARGTTLEYFFEINTGAKSDEAVRKEDRTRMEQAITKGVCRSSKRFLDVQISISYIYSSAVSKAELFRFDISREKCFPK